MGHFFKSMVVPQSLYSVPDLQEAPDVHNIAYFSSFLIYYGPYSSWKFLIF